MVQPVRLVLSFATVLSIGAVATHAHAEPLAPACRMGLVLGVSDQDASDVVMSVCNAAKRRGTTGVVRVSVLSAGDRIRVGVARLADTTEPEQTAHAEAANIAQAIRIAPTVLEAIDPTTKPPTAPAPPPATSAPASVRALAPTPSSSPSASPSASSSPTPSPAPFSPAPDNDTSAESTQPSAPSRSPAPKEESSSATPFEEKAGPPTVFVGAHGSSGVAGGAAGFGAGAAVGFDHRSVQAFIDYSNSSGSTNNQFSHHLATIGGRLKLSRSAFKPVIGGGWSYASYEAAEGAVLTKGDGIGIFAETGAIHAIGNHQIFGLARVNLGLYEERTIRAFTSTTYDGRQYNAMDTRTQDGPFATSFAFLAGYGYVFR